MSIGFGFGYNERDQSIGRISKREREVCCAATVGRARFVRDWAHVQLAPLTDQASPATAASCIPFSSASNHRTLYVSKLDAMPACPKQKIAWQNANRIPKVGEDAFSVSNVIPK